MFLSVLEAFLRASLAASSQLLGDSASTSIILMTSDIVPDSFASNTSWICFRNFARFPHGAALEGFDCPRVINMYDGIELARRACLHVVTHELALRAVDDADRALQERTVEDVASFAGPQRES